MTKTYNTFEELHADYASRFGKRWDPCFLPESDHIAWVEACYSLYPKTMKLRDVYHSQFGDGAMHNGQPFEIVNPIPCDHADWELDSLPAYKIRFTDTGEEFSAYPEELFEKLKEQPFAPRLTPELCKAIDTVCEYCAYISDCTDDEELAEAAYAGYDPADAGAKYCEKCMVRLTYNLYEAMDKANEELPYSSPEWQAIINY